MNKLGERARAALVMGSLFVALAGCQRQEGPAEHAGKQIDKAVDKAGQQIEKAGENLQDATKRDKK